MIYMDINNEGENEMKKKLLISIISIFIVLLLFSVPSNFVNQPDQSNSTEYAGVPPVKMPDKIPPKE